MRMGTIVIIGLAAVLVLAVAGCPSEQGKEGADAAGAATGGPGATGQPGGTPGKAVALKEVQETEPNEKSTQAMMLQESVIVSATLEPAADAKSAATDWYQLAPEGKQAARIDLSPIPEEDLKVVFYDADKNKLFLLDSRGKGEGESYPNLTLDRAAFVQVIGSEGGKGGPYKLTLRLRDAAPGEEVEVNDRYSLATPMGVGESMKGYLGHRRDEDWYLVSLKAMAPGSVLRIDLTPVDGVKFELVAADQAAQAPLMTVKGTDPGKGILVRNLGLPEGAEGIYLVVKSGWVPGPNPKNFIQTFNPDAMYQLSVSSEAGGEDLEKEPNDTAAKAQQLLDGQKIRAYLADPNDIDWFKINVERPSLLSAELSALNRVDLVLTVVDPEKKDEKKGFELCKVNAGAVNEPEILTNCALQPGENFIRVEGAWKNVDGKWVRDFANTDETYTLTVSLRTDEGKEEREPNDKPEQATAIKVGDTQRGTLHPKGDQDYYFLDLSAQEGPKNTIIECTGIPKVDVAIRLLGSETTEKGEHKELANAAKAQGEGKEQLQKELLPGRYLVQVYGKPANESNTRDQYLLTVSQP